MESIHILLFKNDIIKAKINKRFKVKKKISLINNLLVKKNTPHITNNTKGKIGSILKKFIKNIPRSKIINMKSLEYVFCLKKWNIFINPKETNLRIHHDTHKYSNHLYNRYNHKDHFH